jgi:dTDP-4-amino-4,6-dideoxygalactose transaminase
MNMLRPELDQLRATGYQFDETWQVVDLFEQKIAGFFGAPYAVATDCCTHALELSLRLLNCCHLVVDVPIHTYMSVPMMLDKINHKWKFKNIAWTNHYCLAPLPIIDAARTWEKNSYVPGYLMCLSFQFKKHIPIGRGGIVLTDNQEQYNQLQKMVRDGRDRTKLWENDDVDTTGYHYYMTPEDAARGIMLFDQLHSVASAKTWSWQDYKPLNQLSVFKHHQCV